jgi:hypothetical protein
VTWGLLRKNVAGSLVTVGDMAYFAARDTTPGSRGIHTGRYTSGRTLRYATRTGHRGRRSARLS